MFAVGVSAPLPVAGMPLFAMAMPVLISAVALPMPTVALLVIASMSTLAGCACGDGVALRKRATITKSYGLTANVAGERYVLGAFGCYDPCALALGALIVPERDPAGLNLAFGRIFMLMRMRMPPKHELLDNEEHAEPDHQRNADGVRPARPDALHRLRQ